MNSVTDFTSAASATLQHLRDRFGMETWTVSRRLGPDLVVLAALGGDPDEGTAPRSGDVVAWCDSLCASAVAGRAPRYAVDVDAVPDWRALKEAHDLRWVSFLTLPLRSPDGSVLGTLCAASRTPPDSDLADRLADVELLVHLLSVLLTHELGLQTAIRTDALRRLPGRDDLTRVGDRTSWHAALQAEEDRATRLGAPASVLLVEVDGLRELNASAGHAAGDALLVRVAHLLRGQLRPEDYLARPAGDEFAVLLAAADEGVLEQVTDRVRRHLQEGDVQVWLGTATRRAATGLTAAWHAAEVDRTRQKVASVTGPGPAHPLRTDPARGRAGDLADLAAAEVPTTLGVSRLLDVARRQLGMDAAVVGCFSGRRWTVQHTAIGDGVPAVPRGASWDVQATLCQHVFDDRLPPVVPDVARDARVARLPVAVDLGVGSYVGVPVHRPDGSIYGSLCAISVEPRPDLDLRDATVLAVLAEALGGLLSEEEQQADDRHGVLIRLEALHRDGGPSPVYQPIVELRGLSVVGHEALSRFPAGRPDEWFADAARVGVGEGLEMSALRAALRHRPSGEGFLSLNVSPDVASGRVLLDALVGVPVDQVVLEITEHEQVDDYGALQRNLAELRGRGLRIAVDDAGAGFASMRHVLALAPDFIKLDISIIRDVHRDPSRRALTTALTAFALQTGALVVAEGIETVEELRCLQGLGVTHGQGYHLGRPAPAPAFRPDPVLSR